MTKRVRKTPVSPLSRKAVDDLEAVKRRYSLYRRLSDSERYRHALLSVYRENARDYRRSCKLGITLTQLQSADVTEFLPAHSAIGAVWRPFRVERGLTGSMRGEIHCGRFTGTMTTNMLDSSSVLFLKNADGETMRVLLPSPATAREMLAQSLGRWRKNAGYKRDDEQYYWERDRDTHVSLLIHQFARSEDWTNALTHPDVIDMLDASCQNAEDQRPTIKLNGALVQKGVALATAIDVNGTRWTFVPTGFFKALAGTVQKFVPLAEEPELIAA